jgi:hypothetical protein
MKKENLKTFSKYLLLAQSASDAGKGAACAYNARNAEVYAYRLKDSYISQAAAVAKKCPSVRIGLAFDERLDMQILFFEIKSIGQLSFHSNSNWDHLKTDSRVKWNGDRSSSKRVCRALSRKFNLNHYWRYKW